MNFIGPTSTAFTMFKVNSSVTQFFVNGFSNCSIVSMKFPAVSFMNDMTIDQIGAIRDFVKKINGWSIVFTQFSTSNTCSNEVVSVPEVFFIHWNTSKFVDHPRSILFSHHGAFILMVWAHLVLTEFFKSSFQVMFVTH